MSVWRVVRWVVVFVALAVNAVALLSTDVMLWWTRATDPGRRSLPGSVQSVLASRRGVGDADVHVVLWSATAFVVVLALGRRGWRTYLACGFALWCFAAVLEFSQRWVDARTSNWTDLAANTVGMMVGGLLGVAATEIWVRRCRAS